MSILCYSGLISCLLDLLHLFKSNHNFFWQDEYGGKGGKQKILSGYEQLGKKKEASHHQSGLSFFIQQSKAGELMKGTCK